MPSEGPRRASAAPRVLLALLAALVVIFAARWASAAEPPTLADSTSIVWHDEGADGAPRVHVYLFWSTECPHCLQARRDLEAIQEDAPWLVIHAFEVAGDAANAQAYRELAAALGQTAQAVPGLAYCGRLVQGAPGRDELERELTACRRRAGAEEASPADAGVRSLDLPGLGPVDLSGWSLPVTTIVIAGLDAFNPCAFFVLLFLLSLLIHAQSRLRMLLVAGIFVFFSGLWYFLFMAAWLEVFRWIGELRVITTIAGAVAVIMAMINIKDFLRPGVGPSLSIPESAKPGLFRRMRRLVRSSEMVPMVTGTIVLAAAANTYELLCTAGFPMIYTRILTLHDLGTAGYYLFLALYNVVYVIPLVLIVAIFVKTLGSRKLQEYEGRALKLLSGTMMLGLGMTLLLAPRLLGNVLVAVALLAGAAAVTLLATRIDKRRRREEPPTPASG